MKLRADGLTWQEIDGELVILDLNRSVYLKTNQVGGVLTKLLVNECTIDELAAALVSTFEIDEQTAVRDATAFVEQLRSKGLLANG